MGNWTITGDTNATINSAGLASIPANTSTTNNVYTVTYTDDYGCMTTYQYVTDPGSSVKCVDKTVTDSYTVSGLMYFNSSDYVMFVNMSGSFTTDAAYLCDEESYSEYMSFNIDAGISSGYKATFFNGTGAQNSVELSSQSYELTKTIARTVSRVVEDGALPKISGIYYDNAINLVYTVKRFNNTFSIPCHVASHSGGVGNNYITVLYRSDRTFSGKTIDIEVHTEIGKFGQVTRTVTFDNLQYLDGMG